MSVSVAYLQRCYSRNPNPLKGQRLYERLQRDAAECRLGYAIRPDRSGIEPRFESDIITYDELNGLEPDVIFVEGGPLEGENWRIPENIAEKEVARGAVVFFCDVDWNQLNRYRKPYERVLQLCRVTMAYEQDEPVEL